MRRRYLHRFYKKLSTDLTNLLENGEDYNVLIEVGDVNDKVDDTSNSHIFKAHSIILYSRCSYFREVLNKIKYDENNIKKISQPHVSVKVFKIIISYIYGGFVLFDDDESTIFELINIANQFGLEELVKVSQSRLVKNHASWIYKNFTKVYKMSFESDGFEILQLFCNEIIAEHPNILFDSQDFTNISEKALVSFLKLDNIKIDEGQIWDKVIKWGIAQNLDLDFNSKRWSDANFLTLKNTLQNCLPHIRYFHISGEDVLEKVQPYHQILEPELWIDIMSRFMAPNKAISSTILPPRVIPTIEIPQKVTFDGGLKQNASITASKEKKARRKRFKNPATTEWDSIEYESSTTSREWDSATITSDCESIAHDSVASWNINSDPLPVWSSSNLITDRKSKHKSVYIYYDLLSFSILLTQILYILIDYKNVSMK
ncbi:hypothetical protein C2G38_1253963 [Gigaspora rosea]|uniref:BTB domain-containing protein n=1 Tax=Gigaspora rosea TaxID=44941 RepID=A0A397VC61_9GLOM|nr:hypothetical protein C2G38_1253963 [Gigaspora rosea]